MLDRIYRKLLISYTKLKYFAQQSITVGKDSIIYPSSRIATTCKGGSIKIGNNCIIGRSKSSSIIGHFFPTKIVVKEDDAKVTIGNNTNLNGVYIASRKSVEIGNNCRIAAGVTILDHNGHLVNSCNRTYGQDNPKSVIIGNNVWLGTNCIVLKDTVIGDNCVVSCGSIIKGVFEPNSIIQGNPGVVVGNLPLNE